MKKTYLITIHSIIDLITNSSTEIFLIDKDKIQKDMIDLFEFMLENNLDHETTIEKYKDYEYKEEFRLPKGYNEDNLYVIDTSYHNPLLNKIINKFFNPINFEYND